MLEALSEIEGDVTQSSPVAVDVQPLAAGHQAVDHMFPGAIQANRSPAEVSRIWPVATACQAVAGRAFTAIGGAPACLVGRRFILSGLPRFGAGRGRWSRNWGTAAGHGCQREAAEEDSHDCLIASGVPGWVSDSAAANSGGSLPARTGAVECVRFCHIWVVQNRSQGIIE